MLGCVCVCVSSLKKTLKLLKFFFFISYRFGLHCDCEFSFMPQKCFTVSFPNNRLQYVFKNISLEAGESKLLIQFGTDGN